MADVRTRKSLGAVVGALLALAGVLVPVFHDEFRCLIVDCRDRKPRGQILVPVEGSPVPQRFTIKGTLKAIPKRSHVWIGVQVANLLYPKVPEITTRGTWVWEFTEAGDLPDRRFSLVLLLVDETGQQEISRWLQEGSRTGTFPGMSPRVRGFRALDAVADIAATPSTATLPSLPLEMEVATGGGEHKTRSHASNGATRLLRAGEAATTRFRVGSDTSSRLVVRYSNDNSGALESVSVAVDGETIGQFLAQDTGDDGLGWDAFVDSAATRAVDLTAGVHALTIVVAGGDGYGVEIDRVSTA